MKSLLEESHQKWIGGANAGLPIRKSVLEELAEEAKDITYGPSGNTIKFTDKELSILEDIIYNGSFVRGRLNENILEIIQEEAASYFAGDKSAEETAHIIQSRVELILNE